MGQLHGLETGVAWLPGRSYVNSEKCTGSGLLLLYATQVALATYLKTGSLPRPVRFRNRNAGFGLQA